MSLTPNSQRKLRPKIFLVKVISDPASAVIDTLESSQQGCQSDACEIVAIEAAPYVSKHCSLNCQWDDIADHVVPTHLPRAFIRTQLSQMITMDRPRRELHFRKGLIEDHCLERVKGIPMPDPYTVRMTRPFQKPSAVSQVASRSKASSIYWQRYFFPCDSPAQNASRLSWWSPSTGADNVSLLGIGDCSSQP